MSIVQYLDDDVTPLDGYVFPSPLQAGELSAAVEIHAANEGGDTAVNVFIVMRTESLVTPGLLLAVGVPPQDELWGRARIVGFSNAGDPTWTVANTDWVSLGAYSGMSVGDVPAGCSVFYEFAQQIPGTAADGVAWTVYPIPVFSEFSWPVPAALTAAMRGVLHGIGDASRGGVVSGLALSVSGSPDDEVHTAAGFILEKGKLYGVVAMDHTLDQDDGSAATLAITESYWAVRTFVAGVLDVVKGDKAVSPVKPTPVGLIGPYVKVQYDASTFSVIDGADLDGELLYDRYQVVDGGGLNLSLHPGRALGGGTYRHAGSKQTDPLTDASVNFVWQLAAGTFDDNTTGIPPEDGALLMFEVTTVAGAITAIVDRRSYAGETVTLKVSGLCPGSVGTIANDLVQHEHLVIEAIMYRLGANGGGASGSTILDVKVNGATIHPSSGTDDQRPTFAFDATGAGLIFSGGVHEVTDLYRGDKLELVSVTYPASSTMTAVVAEAWFLCRVP